MTWLDALTGIEDLEDAEFDAGLIAEFERRRDVAVSRPIRFSTPTFKEYETSELEGCGKNSFPAFSITAGECGLNCDHCQKKILEPMIPATNPAMLDDKVRHLIDTQQLSGFLLSGGSNRKNEINYSRYMPVIECLKRDFPQLTFVVNGGFKTLGQVERQLESLDGVMIGREAYQNPWLLAAADQRIFGVATNPPSRRTIVERMLPFIDRQRANGVPIHRITRHMLGLFQGQPGARAWRRYLSENAYRESAGVEVLFEALDAMPVAA